MLLSSTRTQSVKLQCQNFNIEQEIINYQNEIQELLSITLKNFVTKGETSFYFKKSFYFGFYLDDELAIRCTFKKQKLIRKKTKNNKNRTLKMANNE